MQKTKIDWCDSTWNPVTGCYHTCEYCYARGIATRFGGKVNPKCTNILELDNPFVEDGKIKPYPLGFMPTLHRYRMDEYKNKKGRNIFVCSMADLFGEWVPDSWIEEVFEACKKAPQHNYIFLTKNPGRYMKLDLEGKLPTDNNFWYGSTATGPDDAFWWSDSHKTFVSIEPILHPFDEVGDGAVKKVDWVIIGAETGRRKDKVVPEREWIKSLVNDCRRTGIPVFMKSSLADIWKEPLIQELPDELK